MGRPKGLPRTAKYGKTHCNIEGCNKPHRGRGWCADHLEHWRRHGDPLVPRIRVCACGCGGILQGATQQRRLPGCRRRANLERQRRYQENVRESEEYKQKARERAAARYNADPEKAKQRLRERSRETHLRDKLAAITRYGGACVCCGVTDYRFLTFQHTNGDGKAHRISLTGKDRSAGIAFIRRLRMAGWPKVPGMVIMCFNCHMAEDLWGGCPHQETAHIETTVQRPINPAAAKQLIAQRG